MRVQYRFSFGIFEASPDSGELWRSGLRIKLHDKPFQLLLALLEHPGEILSREQLQQRLWPGTTFLDFDNGLNNAMGRLRQALRDSPRAPQWVETLPRRGYRFIAPVRLSSDAPPRFRPRRTRAGASSPPSRRPPGREHPTAKAALPA